MEEERTLRESVVSLWQGSIGGAERPEQTIKPCDPDDQPVAADGTVVSATASAHRVREGKCFHGQQPSEYELLDVLGAGGMGIIYRARHAGMDRTVAIKTIRPELATNAADLHHFRAEALATAELEHPNIVPVHEVGETSSGAVFYAMKEVHGARWSESIGEKTLDENLEIWLRVADGVAFAHSRGIIHRDLKPENVMLGEFGEVLVVDWGLTASVAEGGKAERLEGDHAVGGTPCYMAPEMARAEVEQIGPASDVYLLGAILYEIVSGHPPHAGPDVMRCIEAAAENRVEPTQASGELVDAALLAMSDEPADRFPDVKAFQETVREYRRHQESIALAVQAESDLEQAEATGRYAIYAEAVSGYEQALELWPANARAGKGLGGARLAYARCAFGRRDLDLAQSVLDADSREQAPLLRRVQAARRQRDTRDRRIRRLKRSALGSAAIALVAVSVALVWVTLSRSAERRQRRIAEHAVVEFAVEQQRRDADRRTSAPAMVRSAKMLADDGDLALARGVAELALAYDGTQHAAHLLCALLSVRDADYGAARDHCDAVLDGKPGDGAAVRLRDVCLAGIEEGVGDGERSALVEVAVGQGMPGLAAAFADSAVERLALYRKKLAVPWGGLSGALKMDSDAALVMNMVGAPQAADLRPLRGVPLRSLRLARSAATDLTPLAGMPLESLNINETGVTDLSPLAGMPLTNLSASVCEVSDLGPLRGAPIRSLHLECTSVVDLSPLLGMPLADVVLRQSPVEDIGPLAQSPLVSLSLSSTPVCDLRPLAGKPLEVLYLAHTRAADIRPLAGLPLRELDIGGTRAEDISPLGGMPLEQLNISGLPVADIDVLRGMPLKRLSIMNMKHVHDVSVLARLPLEDLALDPDRIHSGMSSLRAITSLRTINRMPASAFWAKYDAGEYGRAGQTGSEGWHAYPVAEGQSSIDGVLPRPASSLRARRHPLAILVPRVWAFSRGPGPCVYYMDNNFSPAGNPMVGQIGYGASERDAETGLNLSVYTNFVDGARSALVLGDYVFLTGGDCQGIRRLGRDWRSPTGYVNPGTDPESIATDGRWLFANNDRERALVHAYSVRNQLASFGLDEQWRCDLGRGRVRGVSYGGNGYLYVCVGAYGSDRSVLAIRTDDGKAFDTGVDAPGDDEVFGVIRHSLAGRPFLLAVGSHALHLWEMADDLSLKQGEPDSYSCEALGIAPWMRGASARGNLLFISFDRYMACFKLAVDTPSGSAQ